MIAPEPRHRPPGDCPVCGGVLQPVRLGCAGCGTQIIGEFDACEFCALDDADLHLLRLFLAARGNLKEVEKHLGVSYPTARARLTGEMNCPSLTRSQLAIENPCHCGLPAGAGGFPNSSRRVC